MVLMGLITLSFHFRYLTDKGYTRTQSLSKDWEDDSSIYGLIE